MYCVKCGNEIPENSEFCTFCGASQLNSKVVAVDNVGFIPDNTMALISYYLGVASLLFGAILGIPAVITGISGLEHAQSNPTAKGKIHAWVGIILGAILTIISISILILFMSEVYWGIFGSILGIPAAIIGINGLKHAKSNPVANGRIYTLVGIILGVISTILLVISILDACFYTIIGSLYSGAILGIYAVITGINGLKHAKSTPEANGKVHAWGGIIWGGLSTIFLAILILMFM